MIFTAVSLNENGTPEEVNERIESFRNGNTNCLITTDFTGRAWSTYLELLYYQIIPYNYPYSFTVSDGIEHVIHFAYVKANYGMRLSHMSYSRSGGTSHIILYNTEQTVARSVIEKLKYGNQVYTLNCLRNIFQVDCLFVFICSQEICAELLEMMPETCSMENIPAKEDNQIPTIEISDDDEESDPKTLNVIPKRQNRFEVNKAGDNGTNEDKDCYSEKIFNNIVNSYSRNESKSIKPNSRLGGGGSAVKRTQSSRDLIPLIPEAKKQKPDPSATDKWYGADVILERILMQEESIKKVLSLNTTEKQTLPLNATNAISADFAISSGSFNSTSYTPTTVYVIPFMSKNLQSMNLPFRLTSMSTNSHLDGNANAVIGRNNDIVTSPWNRRDDNISTGNQSQFMNHGNFLNERSGNNGQITYQMRPNQ